MQHTNTSRISIIRRKIYLKRKIQLHTNLNTINTSTSDTNTLMRLSITFYNFEKYIDSSITPNIYKQITILYVTLNILLRNGNTVSLLTIGQDFVRFRYFLESTIGFVRIIRIFIRMPLQSQLSIPKIKNVTSVNTSIHQQPNQKHLRLLDLWIGCISGKPQCTIVVNHDVNQTAVSLWNRKTHWIFSYETRSA